MKIIVLYHVIKFPALNFDILFHLLKLFQETHLLPRYLKRNRCNANMDDSLYLSLICICYSVYEFYQTIPISTISDLHVLYILKLGMIFFCAFRKILAIPIY